MVIECVTNLATAGPGSAEDWREGCGSLDRRIVDAQKRAIVERLNLGEGPKVCLVRIDGWKEKIDAVEVVGERRRGSFLC
jgi:hypothetical protein